MDDLLDQSYETCRRMHRRHDPTYYWATRRLPREIRPATHALYGYVRTADEIVDGPGRPASAEARRAALDAWERELHDGLAQGRSPHPVVGALVDAGRRHRLPLGELGTYMRSMRIDCAPVRIESWEELEAYMDGSAGSVGRIMAPLLGVPGPPPRRLRAARPGLPARQLHPRRARGHGARPHLPARPRTGRPTASRERDLAGGSASPELRALLAMEVRRARGLFAEAEPAVAAAPASVRTGVRFAVAVYLRVLDRVERIEFDVLGRGTAVRPWQLPGAAVGALRR